MSEKNGAVFILCIPLTLSSLPLSHNQPLFRRYVGVHCDPISSLLSSLHRYTNRTTKNRVIFPFFVFPPGPVTHPVGWNAALHTLSSSRAALSCRLDRASQRRSTLSVPPVTNQGRLGCGARARQQPVCPCHRQKKREM